MKGFGAENKKYKIIENPPQPSKEEIINQAIRLHLKGNITEAANIINIVFIRNLMITEFFSNYAGILQSIGKLKEAAILLAKQLNLILIMQKDIIIWDTYCLILAN